MTIWVIEGSPNGGKTLALTNSSEAVKKEIIFKNIRIETAQGNPSLLRSVLYTMPEGIGLTYRNRVLKKDSPRVQSRTILEIVIIGKYRANRKRIKDTHVSKKGLKNPIIIGSNKAPKIG
jgi:hypothetical protein